MPASNFSARLKIRSREVQAGFTLIELLLVITIIGIVAALLVVRSDTVAIWGEEGSLRRLVETIQFLHHQAIQDGEHYRLEIDFDTNSYRVGVLRTEEYAGQELEETALEAGALSLELAAVLNPGLGQTHSLIPPPGYPSLAEPSALPGTAYFEDVRNMGGIVKRAKGEKASILFSPRGFSEFAVIHMRLSDDRPVTLQINPFTGLVSVYREYRDFEWTYGADKQQN